MNRRAVRDGDPTTTGGIVVVTSSAMTNHGKKVALDGDKATCGNCEGLFLIAGGAHRMTHCGRSIALDGDHVLCPCGKNRLIAGSDSTIFYGDSGGGNAVAPARGNAAYTTSERYVCTSIVHDEQYVLRDNVSGQLLANVSYRIVTDTGQAIAGTTDGTGRTRRFVTNKAASLKIYARGL